MPTWFLERIQELTPTNWIAVIALVVSLISLAISTLGYLRDRPKLKIKARLYQSDEEQRAPGFIEVNVVNIGRRPIYLVLLWGTNQDGVGSGKYFDYQGPGIKLGEHEFKTFRLTHLPRGADQYAAEDVIDDEIIEFERMSIEDSTGKRHNVSGIRPLLIALRADYKRWCQRTGYWKTPLSTSANDAV